MTLQVGDRFNRWTVIGERQHGSRKTPCRCECGVKRDVFEPGLKSGASKSCGCLSREVAATRTQKPAKHPIEVGYTFGRWTVLDPSDRMAVLCRCNCGTERPVLGSNLTAGISRSCGCLKRELAVQQGRRNRKHGLSRTPLYATWKRMVRRCTNPLEFDYHYYGGKGIKVHEPWLDAATFVCEVEAEIGPHAPGMTLDRIDNVGNYEPGNIRWATRAGQAANRGGKPEGADPSRRLRIRRKVTPRQVQQLVEFVQAGNSYTKAAEVFNLSGSQVSRIYRETPGTKPKIRRRIL